MSTKLPLLDKQPKCLIEQNVLSLNYVIFRSVIFKNSLRNIIYNYIHVTVYRNTFLFK